MITGGMLKYVTSALCSPQHILIHEGVKEKGHFKHICVTEFLFLQIHIRTFSHQHTGNDIKYGCLILFACPEGY